MHINPRMLEITCIADAATMVVTCTLSTIDHVYMSIMLLHRSWHICTYVCNTAKEYIYIYIYIHTCSSSRCAMVTSARHRRTNLLIFDTIVGPRIP